MHREGGRKTRAGRMTAAMPEPPGIDPAKAKILRAATRIVAEQGAEQVSLAAVSLASGVSLAVVKAHFKRSGDLLRRLAAQAEPPCQIVPGRR